MDLVVMGCNEEAIGAVGLKASSAAESKASGAADMVGDGTAVGLSRETGWTAGSRGAGASVGKGELATGLETVRGPGSGAGSIGSAESGAAIGGLVML